MERRFCSVRIDNWLRIFMIIIFPLFIFFVISLVYNFRLILLTLVYRIGLVDVIRSFLIAIFLYSFMIVLRAYFCAFSAFSIVINLLPSISLRVTLLIMIFSLLHCSLSKCRLLKYLYLFFRFITVDSLSLLLSRFKNSTF
jgi:hypothetical protein